MKKIVLLPLLLLTLASWAQIKKNTLVLPPVRGYMLLKCDFHMHTVFSDGEVWPTVRVDEAFAEGLDAIAISDHVENTRIMNSVGASPSFNMSYDKAKNPAEARNIILIRAAEISKDLPVGHLNALFLKDVDPLKQWVGTQNRNDPSGIIPTLEEVKKQGGVVLWNHPWGGRKGNVPVWEPIQQELFDKGLFAGISVGNGGRCDPMVLQWCLDRNMTVYSNSDAHDPIRNNPGEYRNMTIVFAKQRSEEAIKQALINRMTVAYFRGMLFGRQDLVKTIVDASISSNSFANNDKRGFITLYNPTGLTFNLNLTDADGLKLNFSSMSDKKFVMEPFSEYSFEVDITGLSKTVRKQERHDAETAAKKGVAAPAGKKPDAGAQARTEGRTIEFTVENAYIGQDAFYKLKVPVSF